MSRHVSIKLNRGIAKRADQGALHGLQAAAEHVLGVSNERVPLQDGILQNSGQVDVDEKALRASIYYDTPYAVVQHEDMSFRHDNGRQAKYLESALTDELDTVRSIIQQALRQRLGG